MTGTRDGPRPARGDGETDATEVQVRLDAKALAAAASSWRGGSTDGVHSGHMG